MELYFVRHAIAAERPADGSDSADRPLTAAGAERMRLAARGISRLGIAPELVLSSPYARAAQTAEIIANELKQVARQHPLLAPGCDVAALATVLQPCRRAKRVLVVGHEPDFSQLVSTLVGGGALQLKKGALCRVDVAAFAAGNGVLIWLLPPLVLRELGKRD